jgi:hypothetical protein
MATEPDHESPLACDLTALSPQQRRRRAALAGRLKRAVRGVEELPDGYAIRFAAEESTWLAAAEFVALERRCCPFLGFALEAVRERGPVRLSLLGREGVKEFLRAEFGLGTVAPGAPT